MRFVDLFIGDGRDEHGCQQPAGLVRLIAALSRPTSCSWRRRRTDLNRALAGRPAAGYVPPPMSQWRILLARARFTQPVTDSIAIGLWVERDGDRYQYFTIEASDTQLHTEHKRLAEKPRFWDAAAMVGVIQIRELLPTVTPLEEPTFPFKVPLDFDMVDAVLRSETVPPIAEATVLVEWTA
jgi:hypothetical protein